MAPAPQPNGTCPRRGISVVLLPSHTHYCYFRLCARCITCCAVSSCSERRGVHTHTQAHMCPQMRARHCQGQQA